MSEATLPDPATWPGHTGNWNRWPNDLGTLNLVTPEVTLRAVGEVSSGQVVPLSRPVSDREPIRGTVCFEHTMLNAGAWDLEPDRPESLNSADHVAYRTHGMVNTHLDALAHVGHNGKGFNGIDFGAMVTKEGGVKLGSISDARAIVTRGVLIDIARRRGVSHLHPGEFVRPEEVEAVADPAATGRRGPYSNGSYAGARPVANRRQLPSRHLAGPASGMRRGAGRPGHQRAGDGLRGRCLSVALRTYRTLPGAHAVPDLLRHSPAAQT